MSMARVDSGHETLFSEDEEDSPTPTCESPTNFTQTNQNKHSLLPDKIIINSEQNHWDGPPKIAPISGILDKGKIVIRPIAFKPVMPSSQPNGGRFPGERYCSTPSLPRHGPHIPHYGSTTDLRPHVNSSSAFSLDRKLNSQSNNKFHYHSTENVVVTPTAFTNHHGYSNHCYDHVGTSSPKMTLYHQYHQKYDPRVNLSTDTPQSFLSSSNMSTLHQRLGGSMSRLGGTTGSSSRSGSSLHLDRLGMNTSGSQLNLDDCIHQTPSPSDSGVAELEAMLKEKDSEINYLRETMEQNEQVIFKVYEEKEKMWERELRKIKGMYENRLKASQQKALKMEQMLMMQTYQLQQEKRKLRQELEESRLQREQAERRENELQKEVETLRTQLEETEWSLCQKSGEISLLKSQLKDSQGDQTTRSHEMLHFRAQVREYRAQLERTEQDAKTLQDQLSTTKRENGELKTQLDEVIRSLQLKSHEVQCERDAKHNESGDLQHEIKTLHEELKKTQMESERLKADISLTKSANEKEREQFEEERVTWLEEKEKVIRYQKQLQLNYMHMYRKTKTLENQMENRSNRDRQPLLNVITANGEVHC